MKFLGCSLSDFVDTMGKQGDFQNWLQAYGKQGQVCGRCGGTFARVVVAGRGTSYCPGLSALDGRHRRGWLEWGVWAQKREPRVNSLCVLITALTVFPLLCTSRPFTSAFPQRAPL